MKLDLAFRALSFVLALATVPGCLVNADETPDSQLFETMNDVGDNLAPAGPILQGTGLVVQAPSLNGLAINGIALSGALIDGLPTPRRLFLHGGALSSSPAQSNMAHAENLEGATLKGILSANSTLELRIDDVIPTADPEIFEYNVTYWDGSARVNLCGENNGVPVSALALGGRWDQSSGTATGGDHIDDPNVFTFACKNAVVAKCVDLGYVPWRSMTECHDGDCRTIEMRDMHQACTRMMRADYCGDGTPHTQNGTLINVWDNFDIQTSDALGSINWSNEAEWSPNGATCIEQVRWSGAAEGYIGDHCPERWVSMDSDCFSADSTFFTAQGFATPIGERSVLRNQFTHAPH